MTKVNNNYINNLEAQAVRLKNDSNGNPRYYISCIEFRDAEGNFIRPAFANMYRGKKYGAGWVFQSYSLAWDLGRTIEKTEGLDLLTT